MSAGLCGHPVRGYPGEVCGLDAGHRGHHSCVTAYCEEGHRVRASQIAGHLDEVGAFCWWHTHGPGVRSPHPPDWWWE